MEYLENIGIEGGIFEKSIKLESQFYEAVDNKEAPVLPQDLQISLRRIKGTTVENKKETKEIYSESLEILEKIN